MCLLLTLCLWLLCKSLSSSRNPSHSPFSSSSLWHAPWASCRAPSSSASRRCSLRSERVSRLRELCRVMGQSSTREIGWLLWPDKSNTLDQWIKIHFYPARIAELNIKRLKMNSPPFQSLSGDRNKLTIMLGFLKHLAIWGCRQIVRLHVFVATDLISSVTQNRPTNTSFVFLYVTEWEILSFISQREQMHTYKFLDRRFGGRLRANIVNMAEIQPKVHLHTSFTHVTLKPWRWRMQDWTLSCRSVLLLTPGVGMVIQQLIEKPSLSQQILWQFSNKQAENTHPCTPTSRTKTAVK